MNSEIFRFATIRAPQSTGSDTGSDSAATTDSNPDGPITESLKKLRPTANRAQLTQVAETFSKTSDFIDSKNKIDSKYLQLAATLRANATKNTDSYFRDSFAKIFNTDPSALVNSDDFKKLQANLKDSLIVSAIVNSTKPETKTMLIYLNYAVSLIRQLAANSLSPTPVADLVTLVPSEIFPLPMDNQDLKASRKAQQAEYQKIKKQNSDRIKSLAQNLENNNTAIKEILGTFEKNQIDNTAVVPAAAIPVTGTAAAGTPATGIKAVSRASFTLPSGATSQLTATTKNVLSANGLLEDQIDVARAVTVIEKSNAGIANTLYAGSNRGTPMIRIGSVFLPGNVFFPGPVVIGPTDNNQLNAGPCAPVPIDNGTTDDTPDTIPPGPGEARILGIADLMVVEQSLARYELGEISHIENVLKSEMRETRLKTSQTTDITDTTETEITDTKTQDLTSTDRYEMQTESQNVINDASSKQMGVTVNASYGPYVTVSANYNTTDNSSTQNSKTASTDFARDTTARAVSSLEKRTLERQVTQTINKIVELNKHNFDNTKGLDNISGVYRWLNKIYTTQIVNYGKRLMLEFIVPEPAAFLRYAMTNQPVDTSSIINPNPPGYCANDGKTFLPLKVQDITRDNYLYWVSVYNVDNVSSPPPQFVIIEDAIIDKGDDITKPGDIPGGISRSGLASTSTAIPDGYLPIQAIINPRGSYFIDVQNTMSVIVIQIEKQDFIFQVNPTLNIFDQLKVFTVALTSYSTKNIEIAVTAINYDNFSIVINIIATLSPEKYQDWQLSTFKSIMDAYEDQKTKYDNAVQAAKIRAGFTQIQGKNPIANRETEKTELKRACISMLTGQRYETFNAMNRNVAPYGYPEIDFTEAKTEGQFIRFFEESFEWENITYVFYPYFWSNKDEWVTLSQLDDTDPLFAKFLQAGAARVQIPVRNGFASAMLHYLKVGLVWTTEGILVLSDDGDPDPLQLSIIDELKGQSGNNTVDGVGTITVTKNSTAVSGTQTEFSSDEDSYRRIIIKGVTYVIKKVNNAGSIELTTPYTGDNDSDILYGLGGILVGQSWEVVLPTDLIKIDNATDLIV